tara:strand:+ start:327 stop:497 length:171 start_codon:yes stop_codon:yes gene_type:complete
MNSPNTSKTVVMFHTAKAITWPIGQENEKNAESKPLNGIIQQYNDATYFSHLQVMH